MPTTLYDRTRPSQPFSTKERTVEENTHQASYDLLLSVERLSLSIDETEQEEATGLQEREEDMPTSKLRFVGERTPLAGDVLVEISSSLETPLRLLRQIYSRLDRL